MAFIDRFKEPSTYAGLAVLASLVPAAMHGAQIQESIHVVQAVAPQAITAIQTQNWALLITAICAALPALAAIFLPEKKA